MSKIRLQFRLVIFPLLFVISVASILFVQLPGNSLLWRELQNTGHTILFVIMALAFMNMLRGFLPVALNKALISYAIAGAVLVIVAVITELGQSLTHREPSLVDIARDFAGILIGLGLYSFTEPCVKDLSKQHCYVFRISILALSSCLLVVSLLPLLHLTFAYVQRNDAFPVIIDFQAAWIRPFMQLNQAVLTQATAHDSSASLNELTDQQQVPQLVLNSGQYPGISIIEPYPDWSAYKTLTLSLYSMQVQAIKLVLRIHDSQHNQEYSDRFNQALTIMPGNNRFRIPLLSIEHAPAGRKMDMRHIANIMLFAGNIDGTIEIYPGALRLE